MRPGEENRATGRIAVNKGLLPYPFGQGGTEIEWPTVCALVVGRLDFCGIRGGGDDRVDGRKNIWSKCTG